MDNMLGLATAVETHRQNVAFVPLSPTKLKAIIICLQKQ